MLATYERRNFAEGEKVWLGQYRNLNNVLHWHLECEIIRVVKGQAQIKIGDRCFDARENACFFCSAEELHYIVSAPDALVDVIIFDRSIAQDITDRYALCSPKLPDGLVSANFFDEVNRILSRKEMFYREMIENKARGLLIDIFSSCAIVKQSVRSQFYKNLILKINEEFAFITFEDAVRYSGYSPSHFSKMFKKLTGMNFSDYLNFVKVENAILLMRMYPDTSMSSVSLKCGFSSVRNYNRVFKSITGYSPKMIPKDFAIDTGLRVAQEIDFNPTQKNSILIRTSSQ
jgi:xylan 1,4-beta-xylosidase